MDDPVPLKPDKIRQIGRKKLEQVRISPGDANRSAWLENSPYPIREGEGPEGFTIQLPRESRQGTC